MAPGSGRQNLNHQIRSTYNPLACNPLAMFVEHHKHIWLDNIPRTQLNIRRLMKNPPRPCELHSLTEIYDELRTDTLMIGSRRRRHIQDSFHNLITLSIIGNRRVISVGPVSLWWSWNPIRAHHNRQPFSSHHFSPPFIQASHDTLSAKHTILASCFTGCSQFKA